MNFTKDMVQGLELIKQVDAKYLICLSDDRYVVALDQHAVDERVKLEKLQGAIFESTRANDEVCSSQPIDPIVAIVLSQKEQGLLTTFQKEVEDWGWRWTFESATEPVIHLRCAPNLLETTLAEPRHLLDYLHALQANSGSGYVKPPCVTQLLQSKACRSAIMFGDLLSKTQCNAMLSQLKHCQVPFQCAHGRPSIYPLVDLRALSTFHDENKKKLNLAKVNRFGKACPNS